MTFQGRKGNSKWSWRGIYLKNKDVGGKWLPKPGSFTRTHPSDIFAVGGERQHSTRILFLSTTGSQASETWYFFKTLSSPPVQAVSTVNYSRTSVKQQEQLLSSSGHVSPWTNTPTGGKQVVLTWRSHPKCKYLTHRSKVPPKADWRIKLWLRLPAVWPAGTGECVW